MSLDKNDVFLTDRPDFLSKAIFYLAIIISLMHIYFNIITVLPTLWQNALHFAGFSILCSLTYPLGGHHRKKKWLLAVDLTVGITAAAAAIYMI